VSEDGIVYATGVGSTTIECIVNDLTTSIEVIVPLSGITLPNRRLTSEEQQEWIDDYRINGPTADEFEIIRLVNIEREKLGLSRVVLDESLMMAARFYTQQVTGIVGPSVPGSMHNFGPYATDPLAVYGASTNVSAAFGGQLYWESGNSQWIWPSVITNRWDPLCITVYPRDLRNTTVAWVVVNEWMNSPGHRRYLLSPEHRYIGVGQFSGEGTMTYKFLSDRPSVPTYE
jgi:hypothetical protein